MTQRHHCFQIQTPNGLQAKIRGGPNMQSETRGALAELIDAVMRNYGNTEPKRLVSDAEADYPGLLPKAKDSLK